MASLKRKLIVLKVWFKELFRFCPLTRIKVDKENLFLICGHRGSPVNEPENTFPSFERALSEGANSLETDICVTKDNEVILWHDWNPDELNALLRENGLEPDVKFKPDFPGYFSDLRVKTSQIYLKDFREHFNYAKKDSGEKISAHIPTIDEFIIWLKNNDRIKFVFLDIKVPDAEKHLALVILDKLTALVEEHSIKAQFIIETFSKEILDLCKEKYPSLKYSLDVELPPGFIFLPRIYSSIKVAFNNKNNVAIILRPRQITIANWVTFRRIIAYDVRKKKIINKKYDSLKIDYLIGCTINNKKEMECLIKSGVNGIQTDYPRRLSNVSKSFRLKI